MQSVPLRLLAILILFLTPESFCVASSDTSYTMIATYYSDYFVGRKTSNGEIFSHDKFTCAHKNIPLGTYVEVTNPKNDNQVILKVNDRCPKNNVLDMTRAAIHALDIKGRGLVRVKILGDVTLAQHPSDLPPDVQEQPLANSVKKKTTETKKEKKKTPQNKKRTVTKEVKKVTPAPTSPPPDRYDILLCSERNQHQADLYISLLPPEYQTKTEIKKSSNGHFDVIIRLSLPEKKAMPILEELQFSHPRISLIPASKN